VLERYPTGAVQGVTERDGVLHITPPGVLVNANPRLRDREHFVGTLDYRVALEDETLDFFAFGHPLVDALVAAVTEDGAVAPVGVAAAPDRRAGAVVDYELRFTGVRDRQELLTHLISGREVGDAPTVPLAGSPSEFVPIPVEADDDFVNVIQMSTSAAEKEIERRFQLFCLDNELNFEAELGRLEKLFAFQRRHFELRIARTEAQIKRLLSVGTEAERRVIPALRGRIETDRRRIEEIEELRKARLEELERRRQPSQQFRPVGVTLLQVDLERRPSQRERASPPAVSRTR
jgi:hypothetical protein